MTNHAVVWPEGKPQQARFASSWWHVQLLLVFIFTTTRLRGRWVYSDEFMRDPEPRSAIEVAKEIEDE